jgi:hypothetical protein
MAFVVDLDCALALCNRHGRCLQCKRRFVLKVNQTHKLTLHKLAEVDTSKW